MGARVTSRRADSQTPPPLAVVAVRTAVGKRSSSGPSATRALSASSTKSSDRVPTEGVATAGHTAHMHAQAVTATPQPLTWTTTRR